MIFAIQRRAGVLVDPTGGLVGGTRACNADKMNLNIDFRKKNSALYSGDEGASTTLATRNSNKILPT